MGSFLRGVVALGAVWALSELLLPEGGSQRAVRLILSLMVMTVLVGALSDGLSQLTGEMRPSMTESLGLAATQGYQQNQARQQQTYTRTYLRSLANQAEAVCIRMGSGAGYALTAQVFLHESGGLERIDLKLKGVLREGSPPLMTPEALRQAITKAFQTEDFRVRLMEDGTQ